MQQVDFKQVNAWDIMPVFLLLLFSLALSIGMGIVVLVIRRARPVSLPKRAAPTGAPRDGLCFLRRPSCWLAIKSRSLPAVQSALGLNNPKPCSWVRGLAGEEKLFIAPPVEGWIVVVGSILPDPCEDPDLCYRFVVGLSRKLGHVQLFSASRILHYHAWVQADRGRVLRAYAWAGHTVWKQGRRTPAERDLDLKCPDYAESLDNPGFGLPESLTVNAEKVPLLAARWSLDPVRIEERLLASEGGVAGEPSRYY